MLVMLISVSHDTVVNDKHEERTRHYYVNFQQFLPLPEEPEVDVEEEEPLDLLSLGLLDDDELVLELEDFEEGLFWFPEFKPEGLEVRKISSLRFQYLWSICWESAQRSMILSGLP